MYQLAAYMHLMAAIIWLGGILFLALVLVPLTRGMREPPGFSVRILTAAAIRFRVIAWTALFILVGTGIWLLLERGVQPLEVVTGRGWFLETLRLKAALVGLILILSAIHDFAVGPRLARELEVQRETSMGQAAVLRSRRLVSWLARINVGLALVVPVLSVVLVRGNPF